MSAGRKPSRPVGVLGRGVLALVLGGALAGCVVAGTRAAAGGDRAAAEASEGKVAAVVKITDRLRFEPATVTVRAGEVVRWKSESLLVHTVTADPARATIEGSAALPSGAEVFDSGLLSPGAQFEHRFTVPGTYRYFCVPHEGAKMRGTVVVLPGSAAAAGRGR